MSPISTASNRALSVCARVHSGYLKLASWADSTCARSHDDADDEAGNYSTEMVVIIAGIVVLAIAVLAVISKKVLDKANSLNF